MPVPPVFLDLPLGERRRYVFAADLFEALVAPAPQILPAVLRLSALPGPALILRPDPPAGDDPAACGVFRQGSGAAQITRWLCNRPVEGAARRLPGRDRDLLDAPDFGSDHAVSRLQPGVGVAKSALILTLALLARTNPAERWDLAELRALQGNAAEGALRIRLGRRLHRFLTVAVFVKEREWGSFILASILKPEADR